MAWGIPQGTALSRHAGLRTESCDDMLTVHIATARSCVEEQHRGIDNYASNIVRCCIRGRHGRRATTAQVLGSYAVLCTLRTLKRRCRVWDTFGRDSFVNKGKVCGGFAWG